MSPSEPHPVVPTPQADVAAAPASFVAELSERVERARASIDSAAADGEEYLAEAHVGELEELLSLAEANGVVLPDTAAYLQTRRSVDLTAAEVPVPRDAEPV